MQPVRSNYIPKWIILCLILTLLTVGILTWVCVHQITLTFYHIDKSTKVEAQIALLKEEKAELAKNYQIPLKKNWGIDKMKRGVKK